MHFLYQAHHLGPYVMTWRQGGGGWRGAGGGGRVPPPAGDAQARLETPQYGEWPVSRPLLARRRHRPVSARQARRPLWRVSQGSDRWRLYL
jgi:hypothetical protein